MKVLYLNLSLDLFIDLSNFGDRKQQRSMAAESDVGATVSENQQPQQKIQLYPTSTGEISSFWRGLSQFLLVFSLIFPNPLHCFLD